LRFVDEFEHIGLPEIYRANRLAKGDLGLTFRALMKQIIPSTH
jgi:hypothetical protein